MTDPLGNEILALEEELAAAKAALAEARKVIEELVVAYTSNVDTCRTAGFYSNPDEDEEVVAARAWLQANKGETPNADK